MVNHFFGQPVVPKHAKRFSGSHILGEAGYDSIGEVTFHNQEGFQYEFLPFQGRLSKKSIVILEVFMVIFLTWTLIIVSNRVLNGPLTVTTSNYSTAFGSMGTAINQFNPKTGVQTFTKDTDWQQGAIALKSPINLDRDFSITLSVNLGNKDSQKFGSDGIAFFFHSGSAWEFGHSGGSLAIGGIKDAFGFKLDTYYNSQSDAEKGAKKGMQYSADPPQFVAKSFGAFINTQGVNSRGENDSQVPKGFSQVLFSNPLPQEIPPPNHNEFRDFSLIYNGETKMMTIRYAGVVWEKNVKEWIGRSSKWYFSIAATTGSGYHNRQQVRIQRCEFTPAKINS